MAEQRSGTNGSHYHSAADICSEDPWEFQAVVFHLEFPKKQWKARLALPCKVCLFALALEWALQKGSQEIKG